MIARRPLLGIATDFLRTLVAAVPYTIHTALTDNAVGRILELYRSQECANYFANAGYDAG